MLDALFGLLQLVGKILFDWWGWVPLVAVLAYLIWQNSRRTQFVNSTDYKLLIIEVPQDNDKQEQSAMQLFASLHGILRSKTELAREGELQEHLSFEIVAIKGQVHFYIWTPQHLRSFVEGQIYAQYPSVNIKEAEKDYAFAELNHKHAAGLELGLTAKDIRPLKTFKSFDVDPLAGITGALGQLKQGEEVWIQMLARPIDDSWHVRGERYVRSLREGRNSGVPINLGQALPFVRNFLTALWQPPDANKVSSPPAAALSDAQHDQVAAVNDKISKLGYETKLRIVRIGTQRQTEKLSLQAIFGAFAQFTSLTNGFKISRQLGQEEALTHYRARLLDRGSFTLNIEELASLYHLPHQKLEAPNLAWSNTRAIEPPTNLPVAKSEEAKELSFIGKADFRGQHTQFGLKRDDRGKHLYVIGQTGTGKSHLLELLALSDIHYDYGLAIIDPHGDLAAQVLKYIPKKRLADVIYFNPADGAYPVAFNPLELNEPALKGQLTAELVAVLAKLFGHTWGPRLEYILQYCIQALLDHPHATLLGIPRMLNEPAYREAVVAEVNDPVVKNFWLNEFDDWNKQFGLEAVAPILNKVGAFVANPLLCNILGQPKSSIDLRQVIAEGKILIVNLGGGQIGEGNAAILGSLLLSRLQLAAMSRAGVEHIDHRHRFYLYLDEFQNFATSSFGTLLSNAGRYGLDLTLTNQYVAQLDKPLREAIFGNVGSSISFRVGAEDAGYLAQYYKPTFDSADLIRLHNRHFIISMSIDGEKIPPFAATTLTVPKPRTDYSEQIIDNSRIRYGIRRDIVESEAGYAQPIEYESTRHESHSQPSHRHSGELHPHEPIRLRR